MSQYVSERWGTNQGFPRGPVYAIDQTADGYLWIGTEKGLVRFDGRDFVLMESVHSKSSPLTHVLGLLADRSGALWTRLRRPSLTLLRYQGGTFTELNSELGTPHPSVAAMSRSRDGDPLLWILRGEGSAIVIRDGRAETLAAPAGFSRSPVLALAQTENGDIWVGTRDAGLFRLRGENATAVNEGLPDLKVNSIVRAGNNELWIGTDGGITRWDGNRLTQKGVPRSLDNVQILAMALDSDSNLWLGTNSKGLLRLNSAGVYGRDDPGAHKSEAVTAIFEDREGNLWSGSATGLERIRDSGFITYTSTEGLPSDSTGPIHVDTDGRTWFAPVGGGLWWLRDGQPVELKHAGLNDVVYSIAGASEGIWVGRQRGGLTFIPRESSVTGIKTYTTADGLAQNSVYAVYEATDGSIWAGTLSGGVSRLKNGRISTLRVADGLASNTVVAIAETSSGKLWFATPNGLSALAGGRWRTYGRPQGLPSDNINCLLKDSGGVLWVGTAGGLAVQNGGAFRIPQSPALLLREQILGIAEDTGGSLWIATANGVARIGRDALLKDTASSADIREYGIADGLRGAEGIRRHRTVVSDSRGRIWFSMNRGISVVDPARLTASSVPAIAHIQSVTADGRPLSLGGPIQIPGGSQRVILGFTGVSLSVPERVQIKYKLDGFDRDWSQPGPARQAIYTNLGPGTYRFHVAASNPDGVWNGAESSLPFEIAPLFWQTWWFGFCAVLAVVFAAITAYRLRLRHMTNQLNVRFEERLAERTRIAQELHDTLLQGFLSASMQLHVATDRLPEDSPAKQPLSRVLSLMGRVIDEGRNAVKGLRSAAAPSNDLAQAFSRVREELSTGGSVDFRVISEGDPWPLHPALRDEVYRIGREALINAFRHSQATSIEVELSYASKRFRTLVRDDGCGIDPVVLQSGRDGHWGLRGMRERAGRIGAELRVRSSAAAGTEVELSVPSSVALQLSSTSGATTTTNASNNGRE